MAKRLEPQLQLRLVAFLQASLKGKSSASIGVPASSLYYWRTGRRMSVDRARELLARLRVSWRTFLRESKAPKTAAPHQLHDTLVITAAALAQVVSHNSADTVVVETVLTAGSASHAILRWGTWALTLSALPTQTWAQLARGGIVLMEGAYSEVLWAEFWRVICMLNAREHTKQRKRPSTLQLQKRLLRLQSPHGPRTG